MNLTQSNALIIGVTSQDGSYLADFLLEKGYKISGLSRRVSTDNLQRLRHFDILEHKDFNLVEGDITDSFSISNIIRQNHFDEIYNLAAMSEVHTSFKQPKLTLDVNTLGVLNILEAIRQTSPYSRFYQAGTSEQFGSSVDPDGYQRETTPFEPRSPYAVSKCAAFQLVKNYRESYPNLFLSNGILFNHTSPLRGYKFVERKISRFIGELARGGVKFKKRLLLGNLDSFRDFGFAGDYVRAMWMILQDSSPNDYVVATGETVQIRELVKFMFSYIGHSYEEFVEINPEFIRPAEVVFLRGDSSKIRKTIGWEPSITWQKLMTLLIQHDIKCPKTIQF